MGRRDHLLRVALSANQTQIQESVTPNDSDDEGDLEELAAAAKLDKLQRLDAAQEAVLSAIGFMSDAERQKKNNESSHKDVFSIATICGLVDYHLPLPLSCQRNSILTFPLYDQSYLSLLRRSWRRAGWSLLWIGMPSLLVYQLGYSVSMHYLQPRIVHKFRKVYPEAAGQSIDAICLRLGMSLTVNLGTWFILYPFWRHATLQSLLWIPYYEWLPPLRDFYPRHNWNTFFLSYFYNFGIWLLQINVHKAFKQRVYPPIENNVEDHEGTYPASLTGVVSDTIPMVLGLGVETILLRSLAREYGPSGLVLSPLELGNVGLMVKALAAEWAVEWAWLEVQYWVNEWYYWYKGYHE